MRSVGSSWWRGIAPFAGMVLLFTAAPRASTAQIVSSDLGITLGARKASSLGVAVIAGSVQSIGTITDGAVNSFPSPVRLQTTWDLNPGLTGSVELVAFFTDPTGALVAGPAERIAASQLKGRMTTGLPASFTAFTGLAIGGIGIAGATLRLFSTPITGLNKTATRTDDLDLQLDLTGQPTLPAGTYTGTLYVRAIAL